MAARKTFTVIKPIEDRFWKNVNIQDDVTLCWEWTASTRDNGYGSFGVTGQTFKAHRFAFWLWYGWWPTICRHYVCDNPLCCNPYHLRDGTVADNSQDRIEIQALQQKPQTQPLSDATILKGLAQLFKADT